MINPYNDILVCNISTQTKAQYALAAGICSLAEKIPYNSISVIQLCRTAHIARSTFYVYYRNIDELLIEMEDQQIPLNVKVVVSNSSNFICASTDYAPDSTVCSKWAA